MLENITGIKLVSSISKRTSVFLHPLDIDREKHNIINSHEKCKKKKKKEEALKQTGDGLVGIMMPVCNQLALSLRNLYNMFNFFISNSLTTRSASISGEFHRK